MPIKKNDMIPLTITGMSAEGMGVGRYLEPGSAAEDKGMVVFVPYTAVRDEISCHILKVQKTHAYGKVNELLTPSPDRIAGPQDCPVFGRCGGCQFRHVTYEAELQYKWQRVADALQRIGGLSILPEPIVASPALDRYRNKAQYPVNQELLVGFYATNSHRIIAHNDCRLQPEEFQKIVDTVVWWAKTAKVSGYNEETGEGLLRHLYIRKAVSTGQMMVCLVCTSGKIPQSKLLTQALTEKIPNLTSVVVNLNKEDTNVVLGKTCFTLWGEDTIIDELCGLKLRLSPLSFYQVNAPQAERLYRLAAEAAGLQKDDILLDLYCGTGTIGLSMAHQVKQLIGVEVVSAAVEDARRNAADNSITNARFICADAEQAALQLKAEGVTPTVVVVDPPRKGCTPGVIDAIASMGPARVVYVSCNPATLARDLVLFAEKGYKTEKVTPVDMFPRTAHVECVVLITKM